MERNFKGVWIPKEIWNDKDLNWSEKLLFVEIDSLDNDNGCYANNEYFSKFFDLSKDRISKLISSLKFKGYIDVKLIYKPGSKQIEKRIINVNKTYSYKNIEGIVDNNLGYRRKQLEGIGENNEDNNTYTNNIDNNITNNIKNVTNVTFPEKFIELYNRYDGAKKDIGTEYDKWIEKCNWDCDYDLLLKRLKAGNKQPFQSWLNKFRTKPSKFPKIIIEEYQIFHEIQTGIKKSDFKPQEIVSLENISRQIESAVKSKLGGNESDLEHNVRQSIQLIFQNWDKIDNFYQKQIKPNQIESNLTLIFKQIKDAHKSVNKIGRISVEEFNNIGSTIDFEKYNNY